jgi:hypothetical protein
MINKHPSSTCSLFLGAYLRCIHILDVTSLMHYYDL